MTRLPLLLIPAVLFAQKPVPQASATAADANWIPTFSDEFDGAELDLSRWAPHDPWNRERNRELQAWALDSVVVGGGQLHLIARRTTEDAAVRYDGKARTFVSGIVTTFGTFAQMYGRFEIRCKIPAGKGLRPGFSLFPVLLGPLPRIAVFEAPGRAPSTISFANDWGTEQTQRSFGDSFPGPDLSAGFHTIAVEWDPNRIVWFVDGQKKFQSVDGVPRQPMFLLIDLAVGGGEGSALTRTPDESTPFPASFDIDYIRVYRRK